MDDGCKLRKLIDVAAGRRPADFLIKNCRVVDVFASEIIEGNIAVCDGLIAGVGSYDAGTEIFDADGAYIAPGFIDSHIHIESSFLSPEQFGRLVVPHGTATIFTDPHEIVNVAGKAGLEYMVAAASLTKLDIRYAVPSCVPSTPFETSGTTISVADVEELLNGTSIYGLGEFMNFPGIISGDTECIQKVLACKRAGKLIDGHSPKVLGLALNAYAAAGILDDHECTSAQELRDRIARGMYVMIRQGSACHDIKELLGGLNANNFHRCVLCSDDLQPKTIFTCGHIDNHLRKIVESGIDPFIAIRMATINAAECFRLYDRGAIVPGRRADLVMLEDLKHFKVRRVWIGGELVAEGEHYLPTVEHCDFSSVRGSVQVKNFDVTNLRQHLDGDCVNVIEISPGSIITKRATERINISSDGEFVFHPNLDIVKFAVIERHKATGNVATGFLKNYGLKCGAIAQTIAHDSHNILVVGASDDDMALAVKQIIAQEGGIVVVLNGKVLDRLPLPIAGLMSNQSGEWVAEQLDRLHEIAYSQLGVNKAIEPFMTLCFMSLPVIPEIKLTDKGLIDTNTFKFIPLTVK